MSKLSPFSPTWMSHAAASRQARSDQGYTARIAISTSGVVYGGSPAEGSVSVQLHGNQLRHARFLHRHAVQAIGNLHGASIVGDEDELRAIEHPGQHLDEPSHVCIVERRVYFVEQTEWTGLELEDREHQRDCGERLFSA